jgi:Anti-sigma-K factor rskA, C-terminal
VNDDLDLGRVERMLERTPAPEPVPETFASLARREALGERVVAARRPRPRRLPVRWRMASAAAAFGAMVAAAVAIAVSAHGGGFSTQYSLSLSGPHGATAVVDFGYAKDGVRPMVLHVHGLGPAGAGRYYEMWFKMGGAENVSAVTFDTGSGGETTIRAVIPAHMHWRSCWVTLEAMNGKTAPQRVLTT